VENSDSGPLTRADFETALDAAVAAFAKTSGKSEASAYDAVLKTPFGKCLYRGYVAAKVATQ